MATVPRFFQAPAGNFFEEARVVDGIRCLPCDDFLRKLVPSRPLP